MKVKKIKDFRASLNLKLDENLVALNSGKMAYNFSFSSGALKGDCPFQPLFDRYFGGSALGEEILNPEMDLADGVCVYYERLDQNTLNRDDKLIVVDNNLQVFYLNLYGENRNFVKLGLQFTSMPIAFCYNRYGEDVIIFCSKTDNMVVWNGVDEPEVVADAPKIKSCVIHNERCFAIVEDEPNTLWFSDDLDPTNWSVGLYDAGFIKLADDRGRLIRLISFGGYLYIFRERGISRLTANGAQEDFYLTHLFVSSGRILEDTITVCGDRIIFVATDGVYVFDGANTTRVLEELGDCLLKNLNAVGAYFDGKYYLNGKVDFGDDVYNDTNDTSNMIYAYDISSKEYSFFRGLDVIDLAVVVSGEYNTLVVLTNKGLYCVSDTPSEFYSGYTSGLYDFGNPKVKKVVRKISAYVKNNDDVTIELYNEKNVSKIYKLKNATNSFPVMFEGSAIGYKIRCKNGANITNLEIGISG